MTRILFAAALLTATAASAQMGGGGMPMGGSADSRSIAAPQRKTLTSQQARQWADCQAMAPEEMAKNMRCQSLKKKVDALPKAD